jgi:hypothetical protein
MAKIAKNAKQEKTVKDKVIITEQIELVKPASIIKDKVGLRPEDQPVVHSPPLPVTKTGISFKQSLVAVAVVLAVAVAVTNYKKKEQDVVEPVTDITITPAYTGDKAEVTALTLVKVSQEPTPLEKVETKLESEYPYQFAVEQPVEPEVLELDPNHSIVGDALSGGDPEATVEPIVEPLVESDMMVSETEERPLYDVMIAPETIEVIEDTPEPLTVLERIAIAEEELLPTVEPEVVEEETVPLGELIPTDQSNMTFTIDISKEVDDNIVEENVVETESPINSEEVTINKEK